MLAKRKEREVLIDGKPVPEVRYYVEICEYISEHHSIPCKSTVVCACYNRETAEWIKSLIMKAYPEYTYGNYHNNIAIDVVDDPFYLSDAYRDVERVRESHTGKHTGYDLSYLSTIF